jgi:phthalate 4,5-dioxygenase oxygenase subunit
MLSTVENELLTRVTGDAPMGRMMRHYWVPVCLSEELAEPDGTPRRVMVFGQRLVAFRDSAGRVGILDEACPHRLASLALGRNEEGGLRCIYHGWKFGVDGSCLDMPTEPEGYNFRDRMRTRAYPAREAGGIVWGYLGPAAEPPPFPAYDWMALPSAQRAVIKIGERANYLQALEGSIDSSHSWFLHQGIIWDWKVRSSVSLDTSPKLEAEDTRYGFRYAAIRVPVNNPETERYVRVTLFVVPFTAIIPRPLPQEQPAHVQIFVPVDDTRTMFYGIFFSQNGSRVDQDEMRAKHHVIPGVHLDRDWFRLASTENWFNQNREAMKNGSFTGIDGFTNQDMACQETMGPIAHREREHLGTSDVAIIRMRRRMLEAVRGFEADGALVGLDPTIPYDRIRSEQKIIPVDQPWQTVGNYAGEYQAIEGGLRSVRTANAKNSSA